MYWITLLYPLKGSDFLEEAGLIFQNIEKSRFIQSRRPYLKKNIPDGRKKYLIYFHLYNHLLKRNHTFALSIFI